MLTPPTDSLYKFLAIFGLAILAWSVTYPRQQAFEYRLQEAELQVEIRMLFAQAEARKIERDALTTQQEDLEVDSKEWLALENQKSGMQVEGIKADASIAPKEVKLLLFHPEVKRLQWWGQGGIALGSMFCAAGFILWYLRVQKHMDAQLNSSEKPSASVENTGARYTKRRRSTAWRSLP